MINEANVKQRYVVLHALAERGKLPPEDVAVAIDAAVKAFPSGNAPVADAEALRVFLADYRHGLDTQYVDNISLVARVFGVELRTSVAPALEGIRQALRTAEQDRLAGAAKAATASPGGPAWATALALKGEAPLSPQIIALLQATSEEPKLQGATGFDAATLSSWLSSALNAVSRNPQGGPLGLKVLSLPVEQLNAGELALALMQLVHVSHNVNDTDLHMALNGKVGLIGGPSFTVGFEPRIRVEGETLELGYDINPKVMREYFGGSRQAEVNAFYAKTFTDLRARMADGAPLLR